MKVNNLMLGDLVEYNGYVCRVYSISLPFPRIEEKYSDKSIITLWCDGFISVTEDEIEPIHITREILKKNGFEVTHESDYRTKWVNSDDDWLIEYSISKSDTARNFLRIYLEAPVIQMRVPYVHELQHALRLCGLSELADNFKV